MMPSEQPVEIYAGEREVSYELSNFFESYKKNPSDATQGNRTLTLGLNTWWTVRNTKYGEFVIRNTYPFVTSYGVYSAITTPNIDGGFAMQTLARMKINARNITTMGTSVANDPIFIPILTPAAPGGGTVTVQWRSDFLTGPNNIVGTDLYKLKMGTYFANSYYGAPKLTLTDDGYWNALYGHMTFDRPSAKRFLGLPGTGNLITEWNNAEATYGARGDLWMSDWLNETGGAGIYDIEAAYDYSNDIRQLVMILDPASTADSLVVRLWSISWGNDMMLMRYFDVSGINTYLQSYFEDMYLNITIGPTMAQLETSYATQFAMYAWNDQTTGKASWMLEATHIDYAGTTYAPPAWQSRYDPYDPDVTTTTRLSLLPGTTMYGQRVSYYTTPVLWNLVSGEELTIKLPTRQVVGYQGYVGASNSLNAAKVIELNSHSYWGEMMLGDCTPSMNSYYDPASKEITIVGPTSFVRNPNPDTPEINESGVPQFLFDVSRVSSYDVKVLPVGGPYQTGVPYAVNVTAKDINGTAVAWDGTISLTSSDGLAVFGQTSHTFANNAYWETTVTFGTISPNTYVNWTDTWFPVDLGGVKGPMTVTGIPEFGLFVIPVVGAVVMFAVIRRRNRE